MLDTTPGCDLSLTGIGGLQGVDHNGDCRLIEIRSTGGVFDKALREPGGGFFIREADSGCFVKRRLFA